MKKKKKRKSMFGFNKIHLFFPTPLSSYSHQVNFNKDVYTPSHKRKTREDNRTLHYKSEYGECTFFFRHRKLSAEDHSTCVALVKYWKGAGFGVCKHARLFFFSSCIGFATRFNRRAEYSTCDGPSVCIASCTPTLSFIAL